MSSSEWQESGGPAGTAFRHNKARSALVVAEVALALILLVGSALLIRTSMALRSVDPGFDSHNVLTMRMSLTGPRFEKSAGVEQMVRDGAERCIAEHADGQHPGAASRSGQRRGFAGLVLLSLRLCR